MAETSDDAVLEDDLQTKFSRRKEVWVAFLEVDLHDDLANKEWEALDAMQAEVATLTAENARLQAEVNARRRTEHQIVAQTEDLARMMLSEIGTGYAVPADFVFHTSEMPRAIKAWQLACLAQEHLTGTDPNDAVANLDGGYDALATQEKPHGIPSGKASDTQGMGEG